MGLCRTWSVISRREGLLKGMTGFPVVIQYKMVYCDYGLDNSHMRAVSYSLILSGTIPQIFIYRERYCCQLVASSNDTGNQLNKISTSHGGVGL